MPAAIRLAQTSDADSIASLVQSYWKFETISGFERSRITTLLTEFLRHRERGACWLAMQDDQPIGYLLAVYVFSLEHGGTMAEIDELFVVPEQRSNGVGVALLREAEREMQRAGLVRVQLQLSPGNRRAKLFYEQNGFQLRGYDLLDKPLRAGPTNR
jgi:GNAT superfamily N-acetyltransferase